MRWSIGSRWDAVIALTAAQAVVYLLARHAGLTVNDLSTFILTVLVFGAGTDYALLLIARYREELRRNADRHEAMAEALHRAGPAITASASTVVLSLLCLLVAELASIKSLGPVTAIGIAVGLGVMLTLLPALLVVFGRWIFWPVRPTLGSPEPTERGVWAGIGAGIARRPRMVWLVTAVALGAMALGLTGLKANNLLQNKDVLRSKPEAVIGEQALDRHFPAGSGDPVQVIGRSTAALRLQAALAHTPGVGAVSAPMTRDGFSYIEGILTSSTDSQASFATVDQLRSSVHAIAGAEGLVGGSSAINLDNQRAARHDRDLVVPLVLVAVFVILALVLRALVAPLLAGRDRGPVVCGGARRERPGLEPRLPLHRADPGDPAVRVRVPGRARRRLQHLPGDQGARGEQAPRHASGSGDRPRGNGPGHHLRRSGARGDLHGPRQSAGWPRDRDRLRGGVRRAA
jgi:RND superfamily putative drug exporter